MRTSFHRGMTERISNADQLLVAALQNPTTAQPYPAPVAAALTITSS